MEISFDLFMERKCALKSLFQFHFHLSPTTENRQRNHHYNSSLFILQFSLIHCIFYCFWSKEMRWKMFREFVLLSILSNSWEMEFNWLVEKVLSMTVKALRVDNFQFFNLIYHLNFLFFTMRWIIMRYIFPL
jgi:hypothetical protein